jgi:RNA polymerase-binding transcription factor DksA
MALNRRNIIQLASLIEARREALRLEIGEDMERTRRDSYPELAGPTPDTGDEAVADVITDQNRAELMRDVEELEQLDAAHRRLADGTYGICVDCGVNIPLARLQAQPAAPRCMACQQRHEKTYRK